MHRLWLSGLHTPVRHRGPRPGHFGGTEVVSSTGDLLGTLKSFSHDLQVTQGGFQEQTTPGTHPELSCISAPRVRGDARWRRSPCARRCLVASLPLCAEMPGGVGVTAVPRTLLCVQAGRVL